MRADDDHDFGGGLGDSIPVVFAPDIGHRHGVHPMMPSDLPVLSPGIWQSAVLGRAPGSFHGGVGKSIEAAVEGAGFPVEDLRVMSEKAGVPMQAFATELVAMACERFKRDMEAEPNLEAVLVMRLEEQRQADQQAKAEAIKQKARIQQQLENMEQQRLQALEQARTESAKLAGQYYVSQYGPQPAPAPAPAPEGVMVKAIRNIERFFPPYRSVDKPGSDV
jgi:hypothetical protein